MAAIMNVSSSRPMTHCEIRQSYTCSSSPRPFTALRPVANRRAITVRAEGEKQQQTDSRDSYQVQSACMRNFLFVDEVSQCCSITTGAGGRYLHIFKTRMHLATACALCHRIFAGWRFMLFP